VTINYEKFKIYTDPDKNNTADLVSSGIYICQLKYGQTIKNRKLILIR
jgi:regulator of replication initiation timing